MLKNFSCFLSFQRERQRKFRADRNPTSVCNWFLSLWPVCSPCFCNPGLWDLQIFEHLYCWGGKNVKTVVSRQKTFQSKSATSFPLGLGRPAARNFSSQSLQKLTQSVTDCIWCDSWAPLVLCEKLYCPWTSSPQLKYSCNSKLPLPSSDRSDCVGWSVDEGGIRIRSTKELFGSDTSLPIPEEYQRSTDLIEVGSYLEPRRPTFIPVILSAGPVLRDA